MHVRFQNSCKKRAEMQKKRQKMHFNLKIHARQGQKWKKESTFIGFFAFISLVHFFLHFKPKNSYKKRQKCKKKTKKNFQIANIHMQKKQKIIFQKNMQKKAEMQKKAAKKAGAVYLFLVQIII